jgi:NADH-quinone oxidoreductase subunit J
MQILFYLAALVGVAASLLVVTRSNAVHALLYLVVSLLAAAVVFVTLGAPFAAALEIILYAGAIMVLFVFVLMMLDLREGAVERERSWLRAGIWGGPAVLALVLLGELLWTLRAGPATATGRQVGAEEVGLALYGPYLLGVELAGFLLLAALVGAFHIGRRAPRVGGTTLSAPHDSGAADGARAPGVVHTTPSARHDFGAEDGARRAPL